MGYLVSLITYHKKLFIFVGQHFLVFQQKPWGNTECRTYTLSKQYSKYGGPKLVLVHPEEQVVKNWWTIKNTLPCALETFALPWRFIVDHDSSYFCPQLQVEPSWFCPQVSVEVLPSYLDESVSFFFVSILWDGFGSLFFVLFCNPMSPPFLFCSLLHFGVYVS